jgi:hypothetical protein
VSTQNVTVNDTPGSSAALTDVPVNVMNSPRPSGKLVEKSPPTVS